MTASEIRSALKAVGITPRQVSVRSDISAGKIGVRIEIKNPEISIRTVREISGIRPWHVTYSREAEKARAKRFLSIAIAADRELGWNDHSLVPLGELLWLGRENGAWAVRGRGPDVDLPCRLYFTLVDVALLYAEIYV